MLVQQSNYRIASIYPHQLFPHYWSAIFAENIPGERPEWTTLQYKIQASELDRLYFSHDDLIGVRFGKATKYVVLDIDKQSPYHPAFSKSEWDRLLATLEDVGLIDRIILQSSFTGGLHIYFWFPEELPTFAVAQLLWATLISNGFHLQGGDLETFPNAKVFTPTPSVYAAHRLPLQPNTGSILLDDYLDEIQTQDQQRLFVHRAMNPRQDMDLVRKKIIWAEKYFKKHRLQKTGLGSNAADWKRCLDDRLELGWTDIGQTNEILRTVCVRSWVFSASCDIDAALQIVLAIPGYAEHCQHQDEILERLRDWMECVTKRYYPYGRPEMAGGKVDLTSVTPATLTERERPKSTVRQNNVLERLRGVVGAIVESATELPERVRDLIHLIQEKGKEMYGKSFGIGTLYNSKYEPEWRILVEETQTQSQQGRYQISNSVPDPLIKASNLDPEKPFLDLCPMKVCFFLRIRLNCVQLFSRVLQNCLNSFQTSAEFSTLEHSESTTEQFKTETETVLVSEASDRNNLAQEQNMMQQQESIQTEENELQTDSISFTNVNIPPAPQKTSITKAYELQQTLLESPASHPVEVGDRSSGSGVGEDDELEVNVGDYLRRIPVTTSGKYYPELIAQVVREGKFGWELTCPEGKSWRCPFNMLGQSWERVSLEGKSATCVI